MGRRDVLIERVAASFGKSFDGEPDRFIAAPGRVNLIGEHTDYNDGFVLPCAIDYETIVAIGPGTGTQIDVIASDFDDDADKFDAAAPFVKQDAEWKNHVRGIAGALVTRGFELRCANIAIAGNIPKGAGLSSSASLGVALAKAFAAEQGLEELHDTDLALIAQQSENDFVGCACGIMDQLASASSMAGSAMLLDCRSLEHKRVSIPADIGILVVHSGIQRTLAGSAFNERRAQCEQAAAHYGVAALRDLDIDKLEAGRADLDESCFRRARHVVTENIRTLTFADALKKGDMAMVSKLMGQSHISLRDDFEVTLPPIDELVEIAANMLQDSGGVRMTGGGFGGCIVALAPINQLPELKSHIAVQYRTPEGAAPRMFDCISSAGASILS